MCAYIYMCVHVYMTPDVTEKIPTAPLNVMAMLDGTTINVTWNKPSRNADLVTSYNLYYNHTGDTQRGDYVETIVSFVA